jgi:hypothetical protein
MQERDCDQISVILIVIKHCTNGLALVFGRGAAVTQGWTDSCRPADSVMVVSAFFLLLFRLLVGCC